MWFENRLTLWVKTLEGDLFSKSTTTFFVCAHVAVLGGELTFKQPSTESRAKLWGTIRDGKWQGMRGTYASLLVQGFNDENEGAGANFLDCL